LKDKTSVCYRGIHQKVAQVKERLGQAQREILTYSGKVDCVKKEKECLHEFLSISKVEEAYYKQKSRVKWLNLGDQNSSYFFKIVKIRASRNLITHLWDDNGDKVVEENQIKQVAVDFYMKLLGFESLVFNEDKANRVSQLITKQITNVQYAMLQAEVTDAEIKAIVFAMKNEKAHGPDGFSVEFFKKAWSIVGQDVIVAIRNFFQSRKLLKATNAKIITLVSKKVNPSKMGDFHPISCCNLIYKCNTKILSNRLVSCLEDLISPNQTAFIPNRSIAENVLLAQEVMKNYHKGGGKARCTMKVDLMKAYDSVNWDFALHSLCCFGMPGKFVSWVRECITSPQFSVAVNGTLVGYFEGKKGFRQGDPLSSYLFVLSMEVLSSLLVECVVKKEGFGCHHRCSKVGLTHLCFADDLLIFSEASVRSFSAIQKVLSEFESLSGLKANPDKEYLFLCWGLSFGSFLDSFYTEDG
jgi:hypothetical protein